MRFNIGDKVFDRWEVVRVIGKGTFGTVYEVERKEFDRNYRSAVKVIQIPGEDNEEINYLRDEGTSAEDIRDYFTKKVKRISSELDLMARLRGNSNIVSYEDHEVVEHTDGVGFDIFIRMELLDPLTEYINTRGMLSVSEVVKLGIDICEALSLCEKNNIIHRDIKPQNIFVSKSGSFKLGDFGVAREIESNSMNLTRVGNCQFMAPEVYNGKKYDTTVDIYSLGLLLYFYLNNRNMPFMDRSMLTYEEREHANAHRLSGEDLPLPVNGNYELKEAILKACSYNPEDRYQTADQFKAALRYALSEMDEGLAKTDLLVCNQQKTPVDIPLQRVKKVESEFSNAVDMSDTIDPAKTSVSDKKQKKSKTPAMLIALCALLAVIVAVAVIFVVNKKDKPSKPDDPSQSVNTSDNSVFSFDYTDANEFVFDKENNRINLAKIESTGAVIYAEVDSYKGGANVDDYLCSKFIFELDGQRTKINRDVYISSEAPISFAVNDYDGDGKAEYAVEFSSNKKNIKNKSLVIINPDISDYDDTSESEIKENLLVNLKFSRKGTVNTFVLNGKNYSYESDAESFNPTLASIDYDLSSSATAIPVTVTVINSSDKIRINCGAELLYQNSSFNFNYAQMSADDTELVPLSTTTTTTTTATTTKKAPEFFKRDKCSYKPKNDSYGNLTGIEIVIWGTYDSIDSVDESLAVYTYPVDEYYVDDFGDECVYWKDYFYDLKTGEAEVFTPQEDYVTTAKICSYVLKEDCAVITLNFDKSVSDGSEITFRVPEGLFVNTTNGERNRSYGDDFYA
jgi:serine/threonine protein kinase